MGLEHFLDPLGINFLSRRVDADASAAEQGQAAIGFYPTPVARNGIAHPIDRAKRLRGFLGVLVIAYGDRTLRSEEHTSELQSLMRISYAVFCLKKKMSLTYHKSAYYYYSKAS